MGAGGDEDVVLEDDTSEISEVDEVGSSWQGGGRGGCRELEKYRAQRVFIVDVCIA